MDNGFNDFNGFEPQDELQRLFNELNRIHNNNNRSRNNGTRARRTSDNAEIIALLRELVYLYNTNIREYQDNMRLILQTIYLLTNNASAPNRTTPINETRNDNDYIYYTLFPYTNRLNRPVTPINTFNENVIVRPTNEQFDAATIEYNFSTADTVNNTNARCPITLEDFQEGDNVCKIRYCGHTFRREPIHNWFQGNVRCPVCRYDIREYSGNNTPPPQQNNQSLTDEELHNNLRDRISNSLMSIIDQYYNEADLSQNLTYAFEFPIVYNDISGNHTRLR
jgi:hypothetical protein